jgi:hypothetical protein
VIHSGPAPPAVPAVNPPLEVLNALGNQAPFFSLSSPAPAIPRHEGPFP